MYTLFFPLKIENGNNLNIICNAPNQIIKTARAHPIS